VLGDKRFLKTIRLRNLLSFGPATNELELRSLNVLIGPNGFGKSNFIEAVGLLQAAPRDLTEPIRTGGGIAGWLWKGISTTATAEIEVRTNVEVIPKADVMNALRSATRDCPTKGEYSKGQHSFEILRQIDPAKIRAASPHADRLLNTLDRLCGSE
jgi:predicted ATPase